MMKRLAIVGALVVAGLAVGVYRAKLGAEETGDRNDELRAEIARTEEELSVLRAEEAYLARPERVGAIARDQLGLGPTSPEQFTAPEMMSRRLGEERFLTAPTAVPDTAPDTAAGSSRAP
jgi:cell division protein FtsL